MNNIDVVNLVIAINQLKNDAGKMKHEAKLMQARAEGMFEAAESIEKEFKADIELYHSQRKNNG